MVATAPEVARALADVLEREALPYAIGGALADVEALLSEQPALDRSYVRRTLIELVGANDPHIATLASIEHDVDAPREE